MGDIIQGGVEFHFLEAAMGNGRNRGITIKAKKSLKPAQTYRFDPNPHDDPWYNKNQGKFYHAVAIELAKLYVASNAANPSFPRYDSAKVKINGMDYSLTKP